MTLQLIVCRHHQEDGVSSRSPRKVTSHPPSRGRRWLAATQQVHCKFPYIGAAALTAVHIPLISGTECLLQETGLTLCEELMIAVCTPMLRPLSTTYSGTDSPKHISRMQLQDSAHCCCGDGVCGCLSAADTAAGTCPKEGTT